jgi:hypothetical protein
MGPSWRGLVYVYGEFEFELNQRWNLQSVGVAACTSCDTDGCMRNRVVAVDFGTAVQH